VEKTLPGPWALGNNFWIEGAGTSILGCTHELVRHKPDHSQAESLPLSFTCDGSSTLLTGDDGTRLLVQPQRGVVAFDNNLTQTFRIDSESVLQANLVPGGNLVLRSVNELRIYDSKTGAPIAEATTLRGSPMGDLAVNSLGQVVVPSSWEEGGQTIVGLQAIDPRDGDLVGEAVLIKLWPDQQDITLVPPVVRDDSASTAYVLDVLGKQILACNASTSTNCAGGGSTGGLIWRSPVLEGVAKAVRISDAVVAFGDRIVRFLDPANGHIIGEPSEPYGSLWFRHVIPLGQGLMMLSVDPNQAGIWEVVLFDEPAKKVASFNSATEGFMVDVDATGRPWILTRDFARLLPLSQYRQAL